MTILGPSPTVADYAARWMALHPRGYRDTEKHNESMVRAFVGAYGKEPLASLTIAEANAFTDAHPGNARYVRTMLNDALEDGLVETNPFAAIRLPKSNGRAGIRVITEAELDLLVGMSEAPSFRAALLFAAYTGVRKGELLALTPYAFALEADDECEVTKQLARDGSPRPPKNGRDRVVLVPPRANAAIEGAVAEFDGKIDERLFGWSRTSHDQVWAVVRHRAGLPGLQWHELRHFAATWFLDHGASYADVAVQLGHTDGGELVRKVYGHPSPQRARERLRAAVSGCRDDPEQKVAVG